MFPKFKMFLIIVFLICSFSALSAKDKEFKKSHIDAAHDFFKASLVEETFEENFQKMIDIQIANIPKMEQFKDVLTEFFEKHMSWESLKDEMAKMYAAEFTEKELKALAKFYRSPLGNKLARLSSEFMVKGAELGMRRVQDNIAELHTMLEKKKKELEKESSTEKNTEKKKAE